MNTFNESAIASYVKTRAEENCKLLQNNMNELEKGKNPWENGSVQ